MSKTASIKRNYIFNLSYQILNLIAPLITTPYISRVLGRAGVGEYSYTGSVVTYFITLAILGSAPYAQREVAYRTSDKKERSCLFWEMVLFRAGTTIFSMILFGVVVGFASTERRLLFVLQGINILSVMFDISWFYQGLEEFGKIVLRSFIIRIVNIILIFTVVHKPADLWIYALIISGLNLIGNISIWWGLKNYVEKIEIKNLKPFSHIREIMQLFLPTVAMSVYRALDKTMLGLVDITKVENGYYEQADKVIQISIMVVASLSTVMAPRIAHVLSQKDDALLRKYMYKTYDALLLLSTPMIAGIIVISDMVVPWFFGVGYDKVTMLLCIFSPLILITTFSYATGNQYLIQARRQKVYSASIIIGAITNFGLNTILIPRFFSAGAAIASIIAETWILIVQLYYVCGRIRMLELKRLFQKLPRYTLASVVMLVVLLLVKQPLEKTFLNTILIIVIGVIIYIGTLLIIRDDLMLSMIKQIKERFQNKTY